jgi:monoamine oxidase
MPRSALSRLLVRIEQAAHLSKRDDVPLDVAWRGLERPRGLRRRDVLKAAGMLAAAPLLKACPEPTAPPGQTRVAVVGGGMAGLHCAYRLKNLGIAATVFEAQSRLGGRMLTDRQTFAAPDAQHCELGGELIDTPHETMFDLKEELGLTFYDYSTDAGVATDSVFFDGHDVPIADVLAAFAPLAGRFESDMLAAESDEDRFAALDALSIRDYFDALVDDGLVAADNIALRLLDVAYTIEYGRDIDEQSALNLLYLVGTSTERLELFGASDELFHTVEGNDAFISGLAAKLEGQIATGKQLVKIKTEADGRQTLSFSDGESASFDEVVMALPFSVLREVDLTEAQLSDDKRTAIDTLGYGTNAKLMLGFSSRPWRESYGSNGSSYSDLAYQATWETSRLQPGTSGILTNYLGGARGLAVGDGTPEAAAATAVAQLEQVWPGMDAAFNGKVARFHWPTNPFVKASYACYLPGQWSAISGIEGAPEGTLKFCGEHTSIDWQGYMEGAAETGARAAIEVAESLGVGIGQALLAAGPEARILARARASARRVGRRKTLRRARTAS